MVLNVLGAERTMDISFERLFVFCANKGVSVFSLLSALNDEKNVQLLLELLHGGCDTGLSWEAFQKAAAADRETFSEIFRSAVLYAKALIRTDQKAHVRKRAGEEPLTGGIEMTLFGVATAVGIDTRLFSVLSLNGLANAVSAVADVKGGSNTPKWKKMSSSELSKLYGG